MRLLSFALPLLLVVLVGCIPFSSFQSARIIPQHEEMATLAASYSDQWNEREATSEFGEFPTERKVGTGWTYVDARVRKGLWRRIDAAIGMTLELPAHAGDGGALLDADIRFGIWKDHVALVLPTSFFIGSAGFTLFSMGFQPGLVVTVPFSHGWDVSAAGRCHLNTFEFQPGEKVRPNLSCNVGVGIPLPWKGQTLRPEVGWLFSTAERQTNTIVGIGFETPMGK